MEITRSLDGTPLAFWRTGSGFALIFVHGGTADHNSWGRVSPLLEPNFTVIAMDRRGRGGSGDARDYNFRREVEDVAAVINAVAGPGDEPLFLFGHSWGGLCCLEAALQSGRVTRLVLYEPDVPSGVSPYSTAVLQRIQVLVEQGDPESAMLVFMREVVEMPEHELDAYRQSPLWSQRLPLAHTIAREMSIYETYQFDPTRFANLDIPVMLLQGGDTPKINRDATKRLHVALPNSHIVILPGQQHIAHHTSPELLAEELRRFLVS